MKKVLSLILTLGLIMSCFAGVSAFAEVSGDGSPETPYLITKGEELAALLNHATDGAVNATKTYYITQDIIMPSTYVPVAGFSGKIKGWDTNAPAQRSIYVTISGNGLFATATGAFEISNITLEGSVTASTGATGGFVGTVSETSSGAKITDCINNASVYNSDTGATNGINIGGFVGLASSDLAISHCVNNASVSGGNSYVGGIIGQSTKSTVVITACANNGEVKTRHSGGTIVGGIAGQSTSPISQCYNTGTITASSATGGITGRQQNTQAITDCFNIGAVTALGASKYAGGIVGYVYNKCSITDCYNTGVVTAATKGEIFGSERASNGPIVTDCYYRANETLAEPNGVKALSPVDMTKEESFNFDFDNTWEMAALTTNYKYPNLKDNPYYVEPNGTIDAPYAIASQADLESISTKGLGKVYSVTASFEVSSNYEPISGFTGTLLGNNKTITLNNTSNGIFATITGSAKVQELNVTGVISVSGGKDIGGIVGKIASGTAMVEKCTNSATITSDIRTGGIAGTSIGIIKNCINNGTITGRAQIGGIVGDQNGGKISYCVNNGTIVADQGTATSASAIGGIVGRCYTSTCSVENCYNTGNLTGSGWDMAGIVGTVHSTTLTISNCYNTGLVSYVSGTGILGAQNLNGASVTVSSCYDIGVVNTYASKPQKPISKNQDVTVSNCYYIGLYDDGIDNTTAVAKDAMNDEAVIASLGSAYELSSNGYNYPQLKNLENTKQVNIYTVNAVSNENGTVTPESAYVHGGDVIEITYEAENGYLLSDIEASTGDVDNTAQNGKYITPAIIADTTFTFTFVKEESEVSGFTLFTEKLLKDDFKDKITDVNYDDISDNYAAVIFVKVSNASGKYYGLEISDDETNWERTELRLATGNVFPYGTYVHSKKQGETYYARVYEYDSLTDTYKSFDNIIEFTLTKPE